MLVSDRKNCQVESMSKETPTYVSDSFWEKKNPQTNNQLLESFKKKKKKINKEEVSTVLPL